MGTIVCGVDESEGASTAVGVAAGLSEKLGSRLVLAHVAPGYSSFGGDDGLTTVQARAGAARLLERVAREHGLSSKADRRAEVGDPAEVLIRVALEEGANVIVVGSRRQGRRGRKFRSGLAGALSETPVCPVVMVPPASRR